MGGRAPLVPPLATALGMIDIDICLRTLVYLQVVPVCPTKGFCLHYALFFSFMTHAANNPINGDQRMAR